MLERALITSVSTSPHLIQNNTSFVWFNIINNVKTRWNECEKQENSVPQISVHLQVFTSVTVLPYSMVFNVKRLMNISREG